MSVDMGVPILEPHAIPFSAEQQAITYDLQVGEQSYNVGAVSMGNPHAVTLVDNVDEFPVDLIGPQIEAHARFPNRVNAGFIQIKSRDEAYLRVFERGVGETLACGTGACAAMVVGHLQNLFADKVTMHLRGGDLTLEWQGANTPVTMTGPATTVFQGQMKI